MDDKRKKDQKLDVMWIKVLDNIEARWKSKKEPK